jgi:hypothetical protein
MGQALARVRVPFRGGAEKIQALLGGQINVSAESSVWAELVLDGRLRLLASWGEDRPARFGMAPTPPATRTMRGNSTRRTARWSGQWACASDTLYRVTRQVLDLSPQNRHAPPRNHFTIWSCGPL